MFAAGDLPDIITMGGYMAETYDAPEFALPLEVLAAIYDPYFLNHVVSQDVLNWHSLADGHFYGMPNDAWYTEAIEAGISWPTQGFFVREDIYNAIAPIDMSTPEGFLDALRAARDYMPDTDHGAPLVPFSGAALDVLTGGLGGFGFSLQDHLAIPHAYPDGTWYDRDAHPDYLEWLLVFRQALEEGLMNNDQFSDDGDLMHERIGLGTYFAYLTQNVFDAGEALGINTERNPDQTYIPINGPRNLAGDPHTFPAGGLGGWTQTFVTVATNDPQSAMQVVSYFASDHGNLVTAFGVEGETFDMVDGLAVLRPEVAEDPGEYGFGPFWMLRNLAFLNRVGYQPGESVREIIRHSQNYNVARLEFASIDPTEGLLQSHLGYIETARAQAVVGVIQAPDEAAGRQIWQEFLDSRDDLSFDEITEYRNERLRQNRARLGQ